LSTKLRLAENDTPLRFSQLGHFYLEALSSQFHDGHPAWAGISSSSDLGRLSGLLTLDHDELLRPIEDLGLAMVSGAASWLARC
jgi:hypothetical protein